MAFVTGDVVATPGEETPFKVVFKQGETVLIEWPVASQQEGNSRSSSASRASPTTKTIEPLRSRVMTIASRRTTVGSIAFYAARSWSDFSNPSLTMRIWPGGYWRDNAMASSVEPFSHVSNCSSRVRMTGMRSWLIFDTNVFGVVVGNE